MKAKEYLLQLKKLDTLIINKRHILEDLRNNCVYRSPQYGIKSKTERDPHATEKLIIAKMDLEDELASDIDKYMEMKQEIIKTIDKLDSSNEIDVIYKKYVQYMTFEEISANMNYTFRWTMTIHANALKNLEKILNSSY